MQLLLLERETLYSRIGDLETRNSIAWCRKNAHLEGSSKIEREAYNQQANQELIRLQQELLAQKEELVFYRGIVAPSSCRARRQPAVVRGT